MASGSFQQQALKYLALKVDWSESGSSSANNTSVVTLKVSVVHWGLQVGTRTITYSIDGQQSTAEAVAVHNNGDNVTSVLASNLSKTVTHSNDGSKSCKISVTYPIKATYSGTYVASITASATVTLGKIARATIPTISASPTFGNTATITLPRASSDFTHDLTYKCGSVSGTIATGATTSCSWKIPIDLCSQFPNAPSGVVTITCTTKQGSTTVGTVPFTPTVAVPSSAAPTISTISVSEAGSTPFSVYTYGKSKLKIVTSAAGIYGSTIKSYSVSINGSSYSGSTVTTGVLTKGAGSLISVTVIDSRNNKATKTQPVSIYDYNPPSVTWTYTRRAGASDTGNESGTYLAYSYKYSISDVNKQNTATAQLYYKLSSSSVWNTVGDKITNITTSGTATGKSTSGILAADNTYNIKLTITDKVGAWDIFTADIPPTYNYVDFNTAGKGVCIGGIAAGDYFDVKLKTRITGDTTVTGNVSASGIVQMNSMNVMGYVKSLGSTEDLNDLIQPGWYIQGTSANCDVSKHYPRKIAGYLEVITYNIADANNRVVLQRYTEYNAAIMYVRAYNWCNASESANQRKWYPWYKVTMGGTVSDEEQEDLEMI